MDNQAADRIRALAHHPGWADLDAAATEAAAKWERAIGREIATGSTGTGPDQCQLDFWRGYWAGCRWLLKRPEHARRQLEALEKPEKEKVNA